MSSWFILSYSTIGNCLAHNYSGIIHAVSWYESLILSATMIIGYLLHIMIYFAEMITAYIKKISDQFEFSYRLQVVMRMLENWNVDTNVKSQIIDAYNILWEKRAGQRKLPEVINLLPKTLQKQCSLDSFWYFIKHSKLLANMDQAFIRNMSLYMECHYFMPGEYLYRLNEMKTRMVYIVSGVIQILSQEDQNSPVMSFSGGTVLSEICSMVLSYSNVNIRCASYCEVQVLDLRKFNRFLTKYPAEKKLLHSRLHERYKLAKTMQNPELLRLKHKEQKRTSIKWIKTQWRTIAILSKSAKKSMEDKQKYIAPHHVSKFLNLYVLTDDVELKISAICLNSQCPFVLEPQSSFRTCFDYLILMSAIVQCVVIPYLAVFRKAMTIKERGLLYMLDVIYICGLYIEFSTAVKESGRLISKIHEIIIYKIKQTNTLIDILSTIPFEFFGFLTSTDSQIEVLMHMNRILKVYRLFRLILLAELNVWRSYIKIRLIKFSLIFIFFLYFLSCVHYMQTCYNKCQKTGWYHYNRFLLRILRPNITYDIPPFIASFDFVSSILISLTWTSSYPYNVNDIIIEHLIVVLGYFLFSFCFAQLGACAVLQLRAKSEYQLYLTGLKHFVLRKNIPHSMRAFMYTMIQCQWQFNDRQEICGPKGILSDLPSHLTDKVFLNRIVRCMRMNPFFMHCDESTITIIAKLSKSSILPPGTIITRENTVCTELYFIIRGYCKAESEIPTDKYHQNYTIMTTGDCFPIMEMLLGIRTFLKVTALTFVELISVPNIELTVHLKRSLGFYEDLQYVLDEHKREYHIVLTRQKGRLPEMVALIKSEGVGDYFVYETNEEVGVKDDRTFERTFNVLGKFDFKDYGLN
ncbi:voltage and ligand gated potassium channel [Holotrichia oblita]|uniref:Voltage and ligand gated potassium channel n=1 Tax=Holotrichia oblita TaxID=644536 RepID=A0ACB9SSI5_HOLOL|nr:voltage and ligand gated potassium channel [Holotrichia oblita]